MADAKSVSSAPKSSVGRSPNYPAIPLQSAIAQVSRLWKAYGKNWVLIADAGKVWNYGEKSSGLRTTVSTLKQYGLLADKGDGDNRMVCLTDLGLDIAIEPDGSEKKARAIRTAAHAPKLYADIFARFPEGVPAADHAISSYLLRERDFNPATVGSVIQGFRANLTYAERIDPDKMPASKTEEASDGDKAIEIGDLIQWEANGALKLQQPTRVRAISPDGMWLFLDGSETGIPMAEAILERKGSKDENGTQGTPPMMPLPPAPQQQQFDASSREREWMHGRLSRDSSYRLIVSGDPGPKEIGKLIKLLKAQQAVLSDDDDDSDVDGE